MPHARARPDDTSPATCSDELGDRQSFGWLHRVDQIDVIEAHPPERALELAGRVLLGPELPPQLVGHDDLVAHPTRSSEQLAEDDLGVAGRDRGLAGLVVVPSIVEEGDARLACGSHHGEALLAGNPFERAPRTECEQRHIQIRGTEAAMGKHGHGSSSS